MRIARRDLAKGNAGFIRLSQSAKRAAQPVKRLWRLGAIGITTEGFKIGARRIALPVRPFQSLAAQKTGTPRQRPTGIGHLERRELRGGFAILPRAQRRLGALEIGLLAHGELRRINVFDRGDKAAAPGCWLNSAKGVADL